MKRAEKEIHRFASFSHFDSMHATLRYDLDGLVCLEPADGAWLAQCGTPRESPLDDLAAAVASALAGPLDYPPLAQSAMPGDRVVLALEPAVPRAAEIVAAVVACLAGAGVDPDGIGVLRTKSDAEGGVPDPCGLLPREVRSRVALVTHDPANPGRLGYLAATDDGRSILLNRAVLDADVVLPVGCLGNRASPEYRGIHGAVYPTFSDEKTLLRFRSLELLDPRGAPKKHLVRLCNEVGWLLGVNFTIQVVPGGGDCVLHVLAGEAGAVRRRGRDLYRTAWTCTVPHRASLVVAAVEGGPLRQTWQNLGLALTAALGLVEDEGAIAVCCGLAAEPGPAVRRLAESSSRRDALRQIRKDRFEDALAAAQLAEALDRVTVYLLSRLDDALVEQLDITPLAGPDELARLVRRRPSCIVLANATHALAAAEES